jgi:hypothetical protein
VVPLLVAVLVLGGCTRTYEVPRSAWPTLKSGRNTYVRTFGGEAYELQSFLFNDTVLVAIRGTMVAPVTGPLNNRLEIPLDSIAVVRVREAAEDNTIGLVASIAVVAGVILLADQGGSDREPTPVRTSGTAQGSCPYVYSFDGSGYVLDSETYAGAMARGLERTDVDNLDHIRPVDGSYRLTLANELDETEYTDELALLVVDHPRETKVYPEASGATRLVGNGVPPRSVRSFAYPDSLPTRAGWELEFEKPHGQDSAALVVTARNGPVLSFVASHLLSLMGPNVYTWYAMVNDDANSRESMQRWLEEETFLHVSVLRDGEWVRAAALPNVGPAIDKTQVIPIDLSGHSGGTVRVRLETAPELWELTSAELAPDLGRIDADRAELVQAKTTSGEDVSRLLLERDGRYHVALNGDRVDLVFWVPPVNGETRTVLVATTGFYYIAADDSVSSQLHEALRILASDEYARQYFQREWKAANAGQEPAGSR